MELTADKVAGMDNIFIESGALNRVAQVVRNYKSQEPLIIADEKIAHLLDVKTDLLLTVGTDIINDITKYVNRRVNILDARATCRARIPHSPIGGLVKSSTANIIANSPPR